MWIFNNNKDNKKVESVSVNSLLSAARIKGDINMDGDLKVDGDIEGDVNIDGKLVIGENGSIDGDVNCKSIKVIGKLTGNVKATDLVSISSIGTIIGDIKTDRIQIEDGGVFVGNIKMELYDTPTQSQQSIRNIGRFK